MDKYTFGDSRAAVSLVSILDKPDNESYEHNASRIIDKYLKSLIALRHIPDKSIRETAYRLWHDHFMERVDDTKFPYLVETHIKAIIVGEYRKAMRFSC